MNNYLVGFDKKTGLQSYWCEKDNETKDESYGFFKGPKSLGVGLYFAPDDFTLGDNCIINFETEEIHIGSENEVKEKEKERKHNLLLELKIKLLTKECNVVIQTIPPKIRTDVIGRLKTKSKHYLDTWQHFYQRCQNLRHDQDIVYQKEARQSASWVVERIEHVSKIKNSIKKEILSMSLEDIKKIDIKNEILSKIDDNFKI